MQVLTFLSLTCANDSTQVMGQVVRATSGRADPRAVNKILSARL